MKAIAVLESYGRVTFEQTLCGVLVKFALKGFSSRATHAIHIHQYGDISKGCMSLGGHYNPTGVHHGSRDTCCRHAGDLINNFTTDSRGMFVWSYIDLSFSVKDILGRSVVIHALSDDCGAQGYERLSLKELEKIVEATSYRGLKTREQKIAKLNDESLLTGNAGKRICCGLIGLAGV